MTSVLYNILYKQEGRLGGVRASDNYDPSTATRAVFPQAIAKVVFLANLT